MLFPLYTLKPINVQTSFFSVFDNNVSVVIFAMCPQGIKINLSWRHSMRVCWSAYELFSQPNYCLSEVLVVNWQLVFYLALSISTQQQGHDTFKIKNNTHLLPQHKIQDHVHSSFQILFFLIR